MFTLAQSNECSTKLIGRSRSHNPLNVYSERNATPSIFTSLVFFSILLQFYVSNFSFQVEKEY